MFIKKNVITTKEFKELFCPCAGKRSNFPVNKINKQNYNKKKTMCK